MTCTCAGTAPGYPAHEDWCGKSEDDDPLECSCYDFDSMEYGPGYPCKRCEAADDEAATP